MHLWSFVVYRGIVFCSVRNFRMIKSYVLRIFGKTVIVYVLSEHVLGAQLGNVRVERSQHDDI